MRQNKRFQVTNAESGNALFIVMIGVVLFAALMFTFSRGARQGGDNLSEQQARIGATELISVAQRYERGINRLLLSGCSENEISFYEASGILKRTNDTAYDYTNADSPGDGSCHLFHGNGGKMTPYVLPADLAIDPTLPCATCLHATSTLFTSLRVLGNGNDSGVQGSDLVMWLGRVPRELCIEINNQLGVDNPGGAPPVDVWTCDNNDSAFTGSFANCTDPIGDNAALTGQSSFCVDYNSNGWTYIYMTVVHAR